MNSTAARQARALAFRQCAQCDYDFLTGTGARACHYYECPYIPELLDVQCPVCRYNFHTRDGQPECSDPPSCDFARHEAPERVRTARQWQRHQR